MERFGLLERLASTPAWHLAPGLALALACAPAAFGQSLPTLPALPLESYEPGMREPVGEALRRLERSPRDAALNGELGMLLYANEQYEHAATCFERARGLAPAEARWAYYLGRVETYLAREDRAQSALGDALRLLPGYLPARLLLARSWLDAGRRGESRSAYEAILKDHEGAAEAHYGLGRIAAAAGEPEAAARHLRTACALDPAFGAAHFALARAYRELGDVERAREHLELYQKDKLGWPTVPDPLLAAVLKLKTGANARLARGIELAEAGRTAEAVAEHEAALVADPTLVRARINLIRLYGELGRIDDASAQYRAAVAQNPALAEPHYNYGVLLSQAGRDGEAREAFARAVELAPAHAGAQNSYAYLLMAAGRLDEAARHYRAALESQPELRAARFNLGRILVLQGRLREAISELRQTLTPEDEETPRCSYALGAAYARAGDRDAALRYMREARQKAGALGQAELAATIDKDLTTLERSQQTPR